MASPRDELEPISLSYWPTCSNNALTWSSEGLAMAAGEVVHILTPRELQTLHEGPGHKQWHSFTLRVNQFEPSEWPVQDMATVGDFSLGEELSESPIVSLAWSPPGLGLYRRPVLAILTSNLVLSLWETNGILGAWQRTCVVNQYLPTGPGVERQVNPRRKWRIRAFHWLPTLQSAASSKWGSQLLAVADDDYTITLFHVRKGSIAAYGQWTWERLAQYRVAGQEQTAENMKRPTSLRTILSQSSPIVKIETTDWQEGGNTGEEHQESTLIIKVSTGNCGKTRYLVLRVMRRTADGQHSPSLSIEESQGSNDIPFPETPPESIFNSAIQKPLSDFNEKYGIKGRVRVHYWGTAFAVDRPLAAACISLHPLDMLEHGTPSSQRTTVNVVFTRFGDAMDTEDPAQNTSSVHERIVNFVVKSSISNIKTDLDRNIARNAAALIAREFESSSALTNWAASLQNQLQQDVQGGRGDDTPHNVSANDQAQVGKAEIAELGQGNVRPPSVTQETCEICDALIPFPSSLTVAICTKGHQFSRCSLSFVAIQEPGVSMYCAKCGRQFLDPGKLELPAGPSLSQALFDEFDVCPYCQGRFRG